MLKHAKAKLTIYKSIANYKQTLQLFSKQKENAKHMQYFVCFHIFKKPKHANGIYDDDDDDDDTDDDDDDATTATTATIKQSFKFKTGGSGFPMGPGRNRF